MPWKTVKREKKSKHRDTCTNLMNSTCSIFQKKTRKNICICLYKAAKERSRKRATTTATAITATKISTRALAMALQAKEVHKRKLVAQMCARVCARVRLKFLAQLKTHFSSVSPPLRHATACTLFSFFYVIA